MRGPTFIRLLAGLADAAPSAPGASFTERLSEWIDWTHTVALSSALDERPPVAEPGEPGAPGPAMAAEDEYRRVRASLGALIGGDRAFSASASGKPAAAGEGADGPAFFRQRHQALQQTMEANIGQLRERLRGQLAARGGTLAQLATLDAVMDRALGKPERRLLSIVPALLERHFARLQQAQPDAAPWLETFRRDMRSVLLAELDLRFQPVQGLLAALRARQLESHVQ